MRHGSLLASGHPNFAGLEVGEQVQVEIASLFLDLEEFTARSFWETPLETARLAHAVLTGFTEIVQGLGGHVLGLRGDGLYACFGPVQDSHVAVAMAGLAAAAALDAVENDLNPRLEALSIQTVRARAGIDFGDAVFVRSGTAEVSEVNVVGFSANFAAKCEKYADSWETVVGEGFAGQMSDQSMISQRDRSPRHKSPKKYSRHGEDRYYKFYDYSWRRAVREVDEAVEELAGRSLELLGY